VSGSGGGSPRAPGDAEDAGAPRAGRGRAALAIARQSARGLGFVSALFGSAEFATAAVSGGPIAIPAFGHLPPGSWPVRIAYGVIAVVLLDRGLEAVTLPGPIGRTVRWAWSAGRDAWPPQPPPHSGEPHDGEPPPASPLFLGRAIELRELSGRMETERRVNLFGPSAVGKSRLALEYLYRQQGAGAYSDGVFWVTGASVRAFSRELASLGRRLRLRWHHLPGRRRRVRAVIEALCTREHWLLVVDGVERRVGKRLRPLLSSLPGHILVTSVDPVWPDYALAVSPLDPRRTARPLAAVTNQRDTIAATSVLRVLRGVPLPVAQVIHLVRAGDDLAELVGSPRRIERLLRSLGPPPGDFTATAIASFWRALARAGRESPAARELVKLCAFLGPDGLDLDLVRGAARHLPRALRRALRDEEAADELVAVLRRHMLADCDGGRVRLGDAYQGLVRWGLGAAGRKRWLRRAIRLLRAIFPDDPANPASARLVPHVLAATDMTEAALIEPAATAALLERVGSHLHERGDLAGAGKALDGDLEIREHMPWPDRVAAARTLSQLGLVRLAQEDLPRARDLLERARDAYAGELGGDHPATATAIDNLACVLLAQRDLTGAGSLWQRALAIRERVQGAGDPAAAVTLNNLACQRRAAGELAEAEALYGRALAVFQRHLPAGHPYIAGCARNLASVREAMGTSQGVPA
jgi:tetratricopeptide (TPR) repeat protein